MNLKIMTYNTMHGLDYVKLLNRNRVVNIDRIAEIIKEEDPDIVGLNEIYEDPHNIESVEQTSYLANKLGYKYYQFGKAITIKGCVDYGNAFLSKYPIVNYKLHKIEDPVVKTERIYHESRVIMEMDVDVNGTILKVLVTHLGLALVEKINGIKALQEILDKNLDKKIIFMGDLNMPQENFLYSEIANYLDDTLKYIVGNTNTFESVNPYQKIDYIFTKNIEVTTAHVNKEIASDHLPLVCEIKVN